LPPSSGFEKLEEGIGVFSQTTAKGDMGILLQTIAPVLTCTRCFDTINLPSPPFAYDCPIAVVDLKTVSLIHYANPSNDRYTPEQTLLGGLFRIGDLEIEVQQLLGQ
jgi:hypothetical protein